MNEIINFVELRNGVKMPLLGFGTYKSGEEEVTKNSVIEALSLGYRHIDTATLYGNEEAIGKGIIESRLIREDIFITSKVWKADMGYDKTLKAFQQSLNKLQVKYLDLYLIHWPSPLVNETWRALEKLYEEGKVRAIGVSNFTEEHLDKLLDTANIIPMVNQIEFHPELTQLKLREFCKKKNIQIEAWAPLMRGRILNYEVLIKMAAKYKKTVAQIVLRWDLQLGIVTIPKSSNPSRIKENADIFDFNISNEDINKISSLNLERRYGPDPHDIVY